MPLAHDKTLQNIGATVSYHHAEAFIQCPRNVFYKNALKIFAHSQNIPIEFENNKATYTLTSADALGKSFMVGVNTCRLSNALTELRALTQYDIKLANMSEQERKQYYELEQELENRIFLLSRIMREYFLSSKYDNEVIIEYHARKPPLVYMGVVDIVAHTRLGDFLIEIKNTNNPTWIINKSGQLDFYKRLFEVNNKEVAGAFYILFPAWFDKNGEIIHATRENVLIEKGKGNADQYIFALDVMTKLPLNKERWIITPKYPINKCKTCQQRFMCKREKGK